MATNVIGVVTTSSPGPTPSAAYAMCRADVPDVQVTAGWPPAMSLTAASKAVDRRAGGQPVAAQDRGDRFDVGFADGLPAVGKEHGSDVRLEHLA